MVGGAARPATSKRAAYGVADLRILGGRMEMQPAVRASAVRDTLAFLEKFERGSMARVLAKVPEESRAVIEATARSGWVGVEHDHHTIDAIVDIFGRKRATEFWSQAISELSDKPLLKAFVGGMLRLVTRDPRRVLSIFATGWPLVYRDMCEIDVVDSEAGNPVLRFRQIATQVRRHRNYLLSWQGGCAGFAKLAGLSVHPTFRVASDVSSAEVELIPAPVLSMRP
jgi:hypothetical protein